MRIATIILLGVAFMMQSFSKGILMLSFQVNREYIAKNLCVKKDQKDNCCKGSCQLRKVLDEDDKRENNTGDNKDQQEIQLFCEGRAVLISPPVLISNSRKSELQHSSPISLSGFTFRPPRV